MHDSPISKTGIITALLIGIIFACVYFLKKENGSFVVFCDVGQGDASYIRIQPDIDILIDAGKDSSVLRCLGKYMPITDRIIELAFITHFQTDHYGGYLAIMKKYRIKQVIISSSPPKIDRISQFVQALKANNTKILSMYAGESLTFSNVGIRMLWPTYDYSKTSPLENDPNNLSQVMELTRLNHSILYTGDISPQSLKILIKEPIQSTNILKIPHHGSKKGLINEFLVLADPLYAVISSGRNNSYGHPSPEIIKMLEASEIKILRTDQVGDIRFSLD